MFKAKAGRFWPRGANKRKGLDCDSAVTKKLAIYRMTSK
jgi:hypothetical protein